MKRTWFVALAGLIGIVVGYFSAHSLFATSWTALIFWATVGLALGAFSLSKKEAMATGLTLGFVLTLSFLIFGFQGGSSHLIGFLALSFALSVLGALCSLLATYLGYVLRKKLQK